MLGKYTSSSHGWYGFSRKSCWCNLWRSTLTTWRPRPSNFALEFCQLGDFFGRGWRSSIFHLWPGLITHVEDHFSNPFKRSRINAPKGSPTEEPGWWFHPDDVFFFFRFFLLRWEIWNDPSCFIEVDMAGWFNYLASSCCLERWWCLTFQFNGEVQGVANLFATCGSTMLHSPTHRHGCFRK